MLTTRVLQILGTISMWYIIIPLSVVFLRWQMHDTIRRRVGWYVIFNAAFSLLTALTASSMNNLIIFYLASPVYVLLVYRVYEAMYGEKGQLRMTTWLIIAYCVFVVIDMTWIENVQKNFPAIIYPIEKGIIIFMAYYFLYCFSVNGGSDFSAFWIGLSIGINALFSLVLIVYTPYIGWEENTIGFFVWYGLGSIISLISYSMVTYGLWIAKPRYVIP